MEWCIKDWPLFGHIWTNAWQPRLCIRVRSRAYCRTSTSMIQMSPGTCSAAMTQFGRFIRMMKAGICAARRFDFSFCFLLVFFHVGAEKLFGMPWPSWKLKVHVCIQAVSFAAERVGSQVSLCSEAAKKGYHQIFIDNNWTLLVSPFSWALGCRRLDCLVGSWVSWPSSFASLPRGLGAPVIQRCSVWKQSRCSIKTGCITPPPFCKQSLVARLFYKQNLVANYVVTRAWLPDRFVRSVGAKPSRT